MSKPIPTHIRSERLDQLHKYMAANNLKSTRQRDLIVKIFFDLTDHISAEKLYDLAKDIDPNIGFATVYRTLKILDESGLANRRDFGDGQARFENTYEGEHHNHMICTKTGKILEFESDAITALLQDIAKRKGFKISNHKIELYGEYTRGRK